MKPKEGFPLQRHPSSRDGYNALPQCKSCHAEIKAHRHLKSKYNLTPEDVQRMSDEQGGCCKLCESPWEEKGGKRMVVDHCHATGKVRGLLCHTCNRTLGQFYDSIEWLRRAEAYLTEN